MCGSPEQIHSGSRRQIDVWLANINILIHFDYSERAD